MKPLLFSLPILFIFGCGADPDAAGTPEVGSSIGEAVLTDPKCNEAFEILENLPGDHLCRFEIEVEDGTASADSTTYTGGWALARDGNSLYATSSPHHNDVFTGISGSPSHLSFELWKNFVPGAQPWVVEQVASALRVNIRNASNQTLVQYQLIPDSCAQLGRGANAPYRISGEDSHGAEVTVTMSTFFIGG